MTATITIDEIFERLNQITRNNELFEQALTMLEKENTNHSVPTECGAPPDVAGQARAEAIATICKNREETNRQLIRFYEKMYDDLVDPQRRHRAPEAADEPPAVPLLPELPEFQTD